MQPHVSRDILQTEGRESREGKGAVCFVLLG